MATKKLTDAQVRTLNAMAYDEHTVCAGQRSGSYLITNQRGWHAGYRVSGATVRVLRESGYIVQCGPHEYALTDAGRAALAAAEPPA